MMFNSCAELLEMYSVDLDRSGTADFLEFVEGVALMIAFPGLCPSPHAVVAFMLRERGFSPLVFWSRIKSCIKPLLTADYDTLKAFGLDIDPQPTCFSLGVAIARVLVRDHPDYYAGLSSAARTYANELSSK